MPAAQQDDSTGTQCILNLTFHVIRLLTKGWKGTSGKRYRGKQGAWWEVLRQLLRLEEGLMKTTFLKFESLR